MTTAVFLGVQCPVLYTHCQWALQPQAGLLSLPGPAAHLHARVAPQRQVSVAEMGSGWQGAEQSRHLCAGSPNVTHGDWQVETKTQSFTRREKNKGIEMK